MEGVSRHRKRGWSGARHRSWCRRRPNRHRAGPRGGLGDILQSGEEDEVFFRGQLVIDHGGVSHVPGPAVGVGFGTGARKRELPCGGANDARGNAEEGGFSGTVAPRQDNAFAGRNFERDSAEGEKAAVTLIDVFKPQAGWRQGERSHDKAEKRNPNERQEPRMKSRDTPSSGAKPPLS